MKEYLDQLRTNGLKDTRQRKEVFNTIKKSKIPLSAIEIYYSLDNIDLATVHRTLNTFLGIDLIEWNSFNGEEKKYSLKTKKHTHSITCKVCGKTEVFDICFLKSFEKNILQKTGFKVLEHQIQFLGLCSSCRRK